MIRSNIFYIILISFYAFLVNWVSGNVGVMPIDTFSFMDTGNSILYGKYPIRDFWIFSGFLLDYIQALFLFYLEKIGLPISVTLLFLISLYLCQHISLLQI